MKKMENIRKIVKSLKESGFLTQGVSETIEKKKQKTKKADFLACF